MSIRVTHTGTIMQRASDEVIEAARAFLRVAGALHRADAVIRLHPHYDDHATRFAQLLQLLMQVYIADAFRADENARITEATMPAAFGSALALGTCMRLGMLRPQPEDAALALRTFAESYVSAINSIAGRGP